MARLCSSRGVVLDVVNDGLGVVCNCAGDRSMVLFVAALNIIRSGEVPATWQAHYGHLNVPVGNQGAVVGVDRDQLEIGIPGAAHGKLI